VGETRSIKRVAANAVMSKRREPSVRNAQGGGTVGKRGKKRFRFREDPNRGRKSPARVRKANRRGVGRRREHQGLHHDKTANE